MANSFRANPDFDTFEVLTSLGTGEALISTLDEKGVPSVVKQCKVLPPQSMMGPITDEEKKKITENKSAWGCDLCQEICPMNKNKKYTEIAEFLNSAKPKLICCTTSKN